MAKNVVPLFFVECVNNVLSFEFLLLGRVGIIWLAKRQVECNYMICILICGDGRHLDVFFWEMISFVHFVVF